MTPPTHTQDDFKQRLRRDAELLREPANSARVAGVVHRIENNEDTARRVSNPRNVLSIVWRPALAAAAVLAMIAGVVVMTIARAPAPPAPTPPFPIDTALRAFSELRLPRGVAARVKPLERLASIVSPDRLQNLVDHGARIAGRLPVVSSVRMLRDVARSLEPVPADQSPDGDGPDTPTPTGA